jgi:hypothetical protein
MVANHDYKEGSDGNMVWKRKYTKVKENKDFMK